MGEGFSVYPPAPLVARFKKGWVIGGTVVTGAVIAAAVAFGLVNRPTVNRLPDDARTVMPDRQTMTERLNAVPDNYAEAGEYFVRREPVIESPAPVREVPKLGPPLHGELGNIELKQRRAGRATLSQTRTNAASGSPIQFGRMVNAAPQTNPTNSAPNPLPSASIQAPQLAAAQAADQNNQAGKRAFLGRAQSSASLGGSPLRVAPLSALMAGTVIPATLITAINSDLPGQIVAQVTAPVLDSVRGDATLIPQGSKLIGEYDSDVAYAQSRVLVVWHRLIYPDGRSIELNNLAAIDGAGASGLKDRVDRHLPGLLGSVAIGSALSAIAESAKDTDGNRVTVNIGEGIAEASNVVTQALTQRRLNVQPTLLIRAGTDFFVFVSRDLLLPPVG